MNTADATFNEKMTFVFILTTPFFFLPFVFDRCSGLVYVTIDNKRLRQAR